jgi:superfamily I DNA and/or RNA helicase
MEDLESILDDSLALSIPSRYLLWHYRSKHESLIAFSNSEYYDNKLLTFPSPDNIESKVRMVHLDGFYDKGKSRQNRREAEAVVKEIERRLSDKALRKRSIGVVTFSSVQQTLIEDLLSDLFVYNPDLENFALECEEPLFVKNLENVQGDERDVILFSVGYGPDSAGRVSMNFGPLNRVGGERRLNVAVSRARYEMMIFSTLRSDQIDLNRTSAVGVAGLKRFLEFAEKGERPNRGKYAHAAVKDASIEHIIAEKLRETGYEVHTNIGSSGYKIDIGIVDESCPEKYILGIICDGENYKRTKTTRDREVVQNSVLRMLGWNICRVWTLDWWENSSEVMSTIENAVKNAKNGVCQPIETVVKKEKNANKNEKKAESTDSAKKMYIFANLSSKKYPSDLFFYPENEGYVKAQIQTIIDAEAPISHLYLSKRVLAFWGISRLTARVAARFEELLGKVNCYQKTDDDTIFIWKSEEQMKSYSIFRPASERAAPDLPPEEVANAIKYLMDAQVSLPVKDLLRITAQLFGFPRISNSVEIAMQQGLQEAVRKGFVKVEGDRVVV